MDDYGVGMPEGLWLNEFGSMVWAAFGGPPYLVGSVLTTTEWRDVDVRVILDDGTWARWFPNLPPTSDEGDWHRDDKWVALVLAFSELGKSMTRLPIDFQIQPSSYANESYGKPEHPRSAIGLTPLRWSKV